MHIPRLKKGKSLSNITSPVNFRDYNTNKSHKLLSSVARSKDFSYKDLKVVENNKKTNFPYIGYFSCRKGKGEAPIKKQKIFSGTLDKSLENFKNKAIDCKLGISNEMGMAICSIFSKDMLPDIQAKISPKQILRGKFSADICDLISNNSRTNTIKTSIVEKINIKEDLSSKGKSANTSFIKYTNKKYQAKKRIDLIDPYHISNIVKNPSFTPFSSLLDCSTDPLNSGFKYFETQGNINKGISLRKKVFEQQRIILKNN